MHGLCTAWRLGLSCCKRLISFTLCESDSSSAVCTWDSFALCSDCRLGLLALWVEALFNISAWFFLLSSKEMFHSFISSGDNNRSGKQQVDGRTYASSPVQYNSSATHCETCMFLDMNTRKSTGWLFLQPPSTLSTAVSLVERLSEPVCLTLVSKLKKKKWPTEILVFCTLNVMYD